MKPQPLFLLAALVVSALPLTGQAQAVLNAQSLTPLTAIIEDEISAGHIPGAVVLIGQNQHIVYAQAFGRRAVLPADETMTLDSIFDLASLTKVVVTTPAILLLAERGALSLDTPVAHYWPEFAAQGKQGITVRHLLAHISGLPTGIDLRGAKGPEDVRHRLAAIKPKTQQPGGEPIYSDVNFAILGELVHRISGHRLDQYFARHILKPLGMKDASFLPKPAKHRRIAPSTPNGEVLRRSEVHDPLANSLGLGAGNAGLFGTAADLALFARALLPHGRQILKPSSVAQMFVPQTYPAAVPRGLGWRLEAPLASNRAALPPLGAASHLGYTGTGLWIDPVTGVFVVILSNRLHLVGGDATPLRARVIATVAEAVGPIPPELISAHRPKLASRIAPYIPNTVATPVRVGIDVLESQDFSSLHGLRIGLLTNRSGIDNAGRRSIDVLFRTPQLALMAIFSPEHGLSTNREGKVANDTDALTGLPVYSLYSSTRRPTPDMLDGLDAIVVDLQDVGARFYTYSTTLAYLMEVAAERGIQIFVLDRPNPVNGTTVQGPMLDTEKRSFTGYWPLPVRHGLTLGEFARLIKTEAGIAVKLTVIPMEGYRREFWYDDTGLPWLPPSPNLTSVAAAILYPGVGMVEGAEVSVGRGTATPFELVGAPWIDGQHLATELERLMLPGLSFHAAEFQPVASRYAGEQCRGVRIEVSDRDALDTPALGLALAATLYRLYPQQFSLDKTSGNIGNQATLDAIRADLEPGEIIASWRESLNTFQARRKPYLLY